MNVILKGVNISGEVDFVRYRGLQQDNREEVSTQQIQNLAQGPTLP